MTTSSSQHRRLRAGVLLAAALTASLAYAWPAAAAEGLRVSGTRVVESNGNNFIMRGINHGHAWFTGRTAAFADMKSYRANIVRVVLSGGRWGTNTPADVANVVNLCRTNRLICVLENHDTTGYGEDGAAYSLEQAVSYFATLQGVLDGTEDYIIINPGNEPIGNQNATQWIAATTSAVTRLRSLGFQHLIMIDAPNWGQDWQYVMRDSAQTIWASDPNANLVFSIHMYGVFNTPSSISSYLDVFRDAGLPLVIGEFGYRNGVSSNVDHDTVMAEAEARGMGYIGWSWCGNNEPYLDMVVNWDKNNLSPWGQRILNGANGIVATAREATIFGGATTYGLTVARAGNGAGTVAGGAIDCGSACSATLASGTTVTLTATAANGSTFAGWSGDCLGSSSTCALVMTAARTVTATFSPLTTSYPLTVAKSGNGAGIVTGPSVNCGTTCAAAYASGTTVTLTATAANGAMFGGWSGACTGTSATCILSMTAARTVTATFSPISTGYGLTVSKDGTGSGTVTSSTGGISCGSACSATYAGGTTVTLTATPASGSQFSAWSGACSGTGATCTVSMTAARSVVATFAPVSTGTPCANPITFTGNTSNFNTTGAVCYRTAQTINGWGCYNLDGRTLTVNGTVVTCGRMPLPAKAADGYTYFSVTAGTYPWAGIYAW